MSIGYIYILSNPSMAGYLKVGYSRDVNERIRELASTGVPLPFEVEYSRPSLDVEIVERLIHSALNNERASANREFFQVELSHAISIVEAHIRPIRDEAVLSDRAKAAIIPESEAQSPLKPQRRDPRRWDKIRAARDEEVRRYNDNSAPSGAT